ncbi:acyl-CoA dehydrogenase family protein, partial [Paraburkholderia sp. BR14264]|uniref:acyl-CoA dehydrogenase family protein n=1 Tax=Paraburkholderia sp. BR14264 TaxID=3237001 RepID=UPI00397B701E
MSLTTATPAILESDFYRFQEGLTDQERESLGRLRTYLESEVRPIADEYWARAEFPMQIIKPLSELGMYGAGVPLVRHFENSAVYRGWAALELGRVDA